MKDEPLLVAIEDGIAKNVRREKIARELNALESQAKRSGERLRQRSLAHARNIFQKQLTASLIASSLPTMTSPTWRVKASIDSFTRDHPRGGDALQPAAVSKPAT